MSSSVVLLFIRWYLFDAPKGIARAWRNFLVWAVNVFSLDLHLRHLLSPWRRAVIPYAAKGFDFSLWFDSVLITNFSRLLGFVIRTVTIFIGLFWLLIVLVIGLLIFIGWYILPFIIIYNFTQI